MKPIGYGITGLLLGVVVGWMMPRIGSGPVPAGEEQASAAPRSTGGFGGAEPERFHGHKASRRDSYGETVADESRAPDQATVEIPTGLLMELSAAAGTRASGANLFGGDGRVEELLGITDREKADIQTAWKGALVKIRAIEAASVKTEVKDDGSVRISLPDLSQSLAPAGEKFRSTVRAALGENRSETFLTVKQVDSVFTPMAGERIYTVAPEETGNGGWRFHMILEDPGGRRVWVSDTIPDEIRHLTDAARIIPSLAPAGER